MKIWCDVCDKEKATVFCSADEAALCDGCDRRVHHANKLASKHLRFSLVNPTCKESPLCDICRERRALLFCQEDRAILCRECDLSIHKANEHTKKHNRFLLTGVKLSASFSLYQSSSTDATATVDDKTRTIPSHSSVKKTTSAVSNEILIFSQYSIPSATYEYNHLVSDDGSVSTSSFSEYLMESIPGWSVEDLLDANTSPTNVFCKTYDQFLPFLDQDLESNVKSCSSEDLGIWEVPLSCPQDGIVNGFHDFTEAKSSKLARKRSEDGFAVPQVSHPPCHKRTKHTFGAS